LAFRAESCLPVLDGFWNLKDRLGFIVWRQEGGASYMADAYGKLTGEPCILFVTRGPGASNGALGVHSAFQDATPMVVFVGQVGGDFTEREALQEMNYRRIYGRMTEWVAQIHRAERIREYVSHAFHTAMAGRPGPVLLALPEEMLFSTATVAAAAPRHWVGRPAPAPGDMRALERQLAGAWRPFALLWGGGRAREARDALRGWIEENGLPVETEFRCQDLFDNRSPSYAGDVGLAINPRLAQRTKDADVLLALGARLGEASTSGDSRLDAPTPGQTLIHVHPGAEELGRVYHVTLRINSGADQFIEALAGVKLDGSRWREWIKSSVFALSALGFA
jgi:acetolactate synthase I/II/III large subunit